MLRNAATTTLLEHVLLIAIIENVIRSKATNREYNFNSYVIYHRSFDRGKGI